MNPIIIANNMISKKRIKEICRAITITTITTMALQINLVIFANNSITRSGSVYRRLINSPTPISSKATAGKLSIFLYKSILTFLVNLISK